MLKAALKKTLPADWQSRARRLSRLRWRTKVDVLQYSGVRLRALRWEHVTYVLWDPEVESHTYDVANVEELARFIADRTGADVHDVRAHLDEGVRDPEFTERWKRRLGRRFDVKSRMMLGNRLLWWGLVRTLKPALCVECGIYNGVGSLVLLRALELNAREGFPGELISVDSDPSMGWVVPESLTPRWSKIDGMTSEVLDSALAGRRVGLLVHDTPHTYENAHHEFSVALAHAGSPMVLLDSAGGRTGALQELCRQHGGSYSFFQDLPANHFRTNCGTGVGWFGG